MITEPLKASPNRQRARLWELRIRSLPLRMPLENIRPERVGRL